METMIRGCWAGTLRGETRENLSEEIAAGADMVAEIEGEKAAFGDGPPGSARILAIHAALWGELERRFDLDVDVVTVWPPVSPGAPDGEIPF